MKPLRLLDLFSGIGGFSLGLERSGAFKTVAFCEIESFPRRVLAKHWPDVPCHDDVTTREFHEGEADAICGGFPCQDVSTAGRRAGLSGARSGLYRELIRAIRLVRPRVALLENVAALLSNGMGRVLGDLAEIGHDTEWHCIPASAVGAPHQRDRIWIIANPGGEQHEGDCAPISGALATELSRANPDDGSQGELQPQGSEQDERGWFGDLGEEAACSDAVSDDEQGVVFRCTDAQEREVESERPFRPLGSGSGWWAVEPDLDRVAYGVPDRAHRLKGLGNAVVPQVVEVIGRAIAASMGAAA